jgi:hypothetical protein
LLNRDEKSGLAPIAMPRVYVGGQNPIDVIASFVLVLARA